MTLVMLRQNMAQTVVADWFGVSQPTVSRIYRRIVPLLDQVTCLHRPPLTEVLQGRVVLIDGALVPVGNRRRDKATHLANFSAKRHKAGLSVQVLSDLDGYLLAVSDPVPGSTHDATAFTMTGFAELLAETGTPTIGDTAYPRHAVIKPRRKRPKHDDHTPADKVWNHSVNTLRAAVERTISHVKNWKILATGYRGRLHELPNLIRAVTNLEHYRLNWQPTYE
jgi:hypothetical protein